MNTLKIYFGNFLDDKRVYALNQTYWDKEITKIVPKEKIVLTNWYNNEYANGQKIYDGNPIYSLVLDTKRSIRITQEEPESDHSEITAFIKVVKGLEKDFYHELVISLELSLLTKRIALGFVKNWSKSDISVQKMEAIIEEQLKAVKITQAA